MSDVTPMQQQLLSQASNILQSITETVSKASEFAAEQIPDIALQYVAYGRVSSTAYILISLLGIILAAWTIVQVGFKNRYKMRDPEARAFTSFLVSFFIGVPSIAIFFHKLNGFFMVWVAPKVWLMRELVELVK